METPIFQSVYNDCDEIHSGGQNDIFMGKLENFSKGGCGCRNTRMIEVWMYGPIMITVV